MAVGNWESQWGMESDEDITDHLPPIMTTASGDEENLIDFSASNPSHDNRPDDFKQELDQYGNSSKMVETSTDTRFPNKTVSEQEAKDSLYLNDDANGVVFGETLNEMMLRLSNEFAPINEPGADTLLYIGPPPRSARQDDYEYNVIQAHFHKPYLMRSSTLKALNSPKFDKFLGPMSARTERRLKKLGIHTCVPDRDKIKYYIDLRPDIEGDEGLLLLTELTSGLGVLSWHRNASRFRIDPRIVAGTDELNAPPRPRYDFSKDEEVVTYEEISLDSDEAQEPPSSPSKRRKKSIVNSSKPQWLKAEDKLAELYNRPIGEDYSPLRHHSAIERLLHAIAGNDPKLDSAPKAWTFCAVANYFDCSANPKINVWLISWLLASQNTNFIQANPEVVYRMAMAMKSPGLLRCTFAMLVGEKALQKSKTETIKTVGEPKKTVHGRTICNIDDDDINRIDHAVPSLSNRAKAAFLRLTHSFMYWTLSCREREQLESVIMNTQEEHNLVLKTKKLLADYVRRQILTATLEHMMFDTKKPETSNTYKLSSYIKVYDDLTPSQRLLTQSFWIMLARRGFYTDNDRPSESVHWQENLPYLKKTGVVAADDDVPFVSRVQLFSAFADVNHMIAAKYHARNPPQAKSRLVKSKRPAPGEMSDFVGGLDPYGRQTLDLDGLPRSLAMRPRKMQLPPPKFQPAHAGFSTSVDVPQSLPKASNTKFTENFEDLDSNWSATLTDRTLFPFEPEEDTHTLVETRTPHDHHLEQQQGESSGNHAEDSWDDEEPFRFGAEHTEQTADESPRTRARFEPAIDIDQLELGIDRAPDDMIAEGKSVQVQLSMDDEVSEKERHEKQNSKKADFFHDHRTRQMQLISAPQLLTELTIEMRTIVDDTMIMPGYVADKTCEWDIPVDENDTLLCLTDDEWKYLPLWAGGLDDGTGGVFDDGVEVPDAPDVDDGGFRGGVMGLHSAVNSDAGSVLGSDFEEILTETGISTVGKASRNATDGTVGGSTVMSLDE